MKFLVIGGGGREHALVWKLRQSPLADRVYAAPGNAGTAIDAENVPIRADDLAGLLRFAKQEKIDLTVVGPEAPLAAGIVDLFEQEGLRIFGPSKAAAELESSKIFCKNILRSAAVPTAEFHTFASRAEAVQFLNQREDEPVVVKADGLAAGKGVFVCDNRQQALQALDRLGNEGEFGSAGQRVVLEERLHGEEASVL
ncbi:MAG TPA: phosphoribosylamine--glycine ligase, partial [Thermoguttaceae bacterium]|nr:phosphoribosylamine--glycine ligase [Thermoguttaceae bacterium]